MTKKDYIALGNLIKEAKWAAKNPDYLNLLADFFQQDNPRFLRQRWLDYIAGRCGPNGGKLA